MPRKRKPAQLSLLDAIEATPVPPIPRTLPPFMAVQTTGNRTTDLVQQIKRDTLILAEGMVSDPEFYQQRIETNRSLVLHADSCAP